MWRNYLFRKFGSSNARPRYSGDEEWWTRRSKRRRYYDDSMDNLSEFQDDRRYRICRRMVSISFTFSRPYISPFSKFRQCRWSIVPVNDAISPGIDIISSEIGAITVASRPFPVVIAIFLVPTIFFAQLPPKERDFRPQTPPHPPT